MLLCKSLFSIFLRCGLVTDRNIQKLNLNKIIKVAMYKPVHTLLKKRECMGTCNDISLEICLLRLSEELSRVKQKNLISEIEKT